MSAPSINNLPFVLRPGYVAVYGNGTISGTSGSVPTVQSFVFGYVYSVWDGGRSDVLTSSSVMFNKNDAKCILLVNSYPYTIIEQSKLIITEVPPT